MLSSVCQAIQFSVVECEYFDDCNSFEHMLKAGGVHSVKYLKANTSVMCIVPRVKLGNSDHVINTKMLSNITFSC